jgi:hypothetical protein
MNESFDAVEMTKLKRKLPRSIWTWPVLLPLGAASITIWGYARWCDGRNEPLGLYLGAGLLITGFYSLYLHLFGNTDSGE